MVGKATWAARAVVYIGLVLIQWAAVGFLQGACCSLVGNVVATTRSLD